MFEKQIELLFSIINEEFNIEKEDIISKSRKTEFIDARRMIAVISKRNSKLSLAKIGSLLGGKDHATILHAVRRHKSLYETDKKYSSEFDKVNYKFLSNPLIAEDISNVIKKLKNRKIKIVNQIEGEIEKIKNSENLDKKKELNIGLFFGTFNPIHSGHLAIANTALFECDFDEVWFIVSNQSPNKIENDDILPLKDRFNLIKSCIVDNPHLKVSNIEEKLPKPSYTYKTLSEFRKKYEKHKFSIIIGSDNANDIHNWKNYEEILIYHQIYYFERGDKLRDKSVIKKLNIKKINSSFITNISSTKIREIIKNEESLDKLRYIVPDECLYLIEKNNYYLNKILNEKTLSS